MTTIACNLKEMAGDTCVAWEGIGSDVYSSIKIYPSEKAVYGVCGENCDGVIIALEWLKAGASLASAGERPAPPESADWRILELSHNGISLYNTLLERDTTLEGMLAIGSGRKVALYCMRVLKMSPAEAVREACKMDAWSAPPIYVASIKDKTVRKWGV